MERLVLHAVMKLVHTQVWVVRIDLQQSKI